MGGRVHSTAVVHSIKGRARIPLVVSVPSSEALKQKHCVYPGTAEDMEDGVDRAPDAMHTSARASKDGVLLTPK